MASPPRIENGLTLQFRNPTDAEQKSLDTQTAALGFDVPWIQRDHVHIELTYQVTNTDSKAGMCNIGIDGANEYTKYDENIVAMTLGMGNNDPPQYIPLIPVTPQILGPGQTISGTVREDDFNEAELDLDAIGRWMAPFNAVLINNSQVNPIGLEHGAAERRDPRPHRDRRQLHGGRRMTCDYDIRVRDDNDQLLHDTDEHSLLADADAVRPACDDVTRTNQGPLRPRRSRKLMAALATSWLLAGASAARAQVTAEPPAPSSSPTRTSSPTASTPRGRSARWPSSARRAEASRPASPSARASATTSSAGWRVQAHFLGSTHQLSEATGPLSEQLLQTYQAVVEGKLTLRFGQTSIFGEGGIGVARLSTNALYVLMVEPQYRVGFVAGGGGRRSTTTRCRATSRSGSAATTWS